MKSTTSEGSYASSYDGEVRILVTLMERVWSTTMEYVRVVSVMVINFDGVALWQKGYRQYLV